MPLTPKGNKIMASMRSEYGAKKGTRVFYATRNKGKIKGVERTSSVSLKRKANNKPAKGRGLAPEYIGSYAPKGVGEMYGQ